MLFCITVEVDRHDGDTVVIHYVEGEMNESRDFYCMPNQEDIDRNVPVSGCFLLSSPSNTERERKYGFSFNIQELLSARQFFVHSS
jgi:hypothetical protein